MTTAQELAMAFAYSTWHTATAKGRVHKLIACIDARFAELREKERGDHAGERTELSADEWEPTEEQAGDIAESHAFGTVAHIVRAAMKEGHRIAREESCSNTSSAVSSPRVSFSSATTSTEAERTAVATKPDAPTESGTPSPKSGASSLDERAEALFAANPGWRPGDDWKLTFDGESWQWVEHYSGCPMAEYPLKSVVQPFLLSALLPRAIDKWWDAYSLPYKNDPPRDLESAIRVLEGK